MVIFAGDVTPVDIMAHMPGKLIDHLPCCLCLILIFLFTAVCEEKQIPYVYTPSRLELGHSLGLKRTSLMVLVREHTDYQTAFTELAEELKAIPSPF